MFEQLLSELANRPAVQGITMIDVLDMPAPLDGVLRAMLREGTLSSSRLAQELALVEDQARILGALLVEKGIVTAEHPAGGEPIPAQRLEPLLVRDVASLAAGAPLDGVSKLPLTEPALRQAHEVFITSSIREIVPIVKVDDDLIGDGRPGPTTQRIRELFAEYVESYLTGP